MLEEGGGVRDGVSRPGNLNPGHSLTSFDNDAVSICARTGPKDPISAGAWVRAVCAQFPPPPSGASTRLLLA